MPDDDEGLISEAAWEKWRRHHYRYEGSGEPIKVDGKLPPMTSDEYQRLTLPQWETVTLAEAMKLPLRAGDSIEADDGNPDTIATVTWGAKPPQPALQWVYEELPGGKPQPENIGTMSAPPDWRSDGNGGYVAAEPITRSNLREGEGYTLRHAETADGRTLTYAVPTKVEPDDDSAFYATRGWVRELIAAALDERFEE